MVSEGFGGVAQGRWQMLDRGRRYEETVRSAALLKTVELMGLQLFNCIARVIEADLAGKLPAGGRPEKETAA